MKAALVLVATTALSGCFTSWVVTQAAGGARYLDEGARDEAVPLAGAVERLTITMPVTRRFFVQPAQPQSSPPVAPPPSDTPPVRAPFAFVCSVDQAGTNEITHAAFRYGSKWKLTTGLMVLAQAALGATFLFTEPAKPENKVAQQAFGGFLAADALGTAVLFFIPRKEVFRVEQQHVVTPIRTDCPEGLVLAVGLESFPLDATGSPGDAGLTALDQWMASPAGYLTLSFNGQPLRLDFTEVDRCTWNHDRHQASCPLTNGRDAVSANLTVPVGTLSTSSEPAAPNAR